MTSSVVLPLLLLLFGLATTEDWTVTIQTCHQDKAGTGSGLSITVYGLRGQASHGLSGSYERGDRDYTHFSATIGKPYKISIHHDGHGWFSGWCMDWTQLYSSAGTFTFTCSGGCWFDGNSKDFTPDECNDGDPIQNCISHTRVHCFLSRCNRCSSSYRAVSDGSRCERCNQYSPITQCTQYADCGNRECHTCADKYYLTSNKHECRMCPKLPDCTKTLCTSPSNRWCTRCRDSKLFKIDSNRLCARTCSWEDRWCWPGKCTDNFASGCHCAPGFSVTKSNSAARCEPAVKPNITTCMMSVESKGGVIARSPTTGNSKCLYQKDFYGNFQVAKIVFKSEFYYDFAINKSIFIQPAYINGFTFGITDVGYEIFKKLKSGADIPLKRLAVKSDPHTLTPEVTVNKDMNVTEIDTWSASNLTNGDRLCVRFKTKGGGYLESVNLHTTEHRISRIPYSKVSNQRDLCYYFDDAEPQHCFENNCSEDPLIINNRITRSRDMIIQFQGWFDPSPLPGNDVFASGIKEYEITVYEVTESGLSNLDLATEKMFSVVSNSSNPIKWRVPESRANPALYAVVLEVTDVASNVHQARRFFLYDNCSDIETDAKNRIITTSATNKTNYIWQINHNPLCFDWTGHFYNNKYAVTNLLKPIKPDAYGLIKGNYDQITGKLPIAGTPNVDGIISFSYALKKNNEMIMPKIKMQNFTRQNICLSVPSADGDTFLLMIEAQDIVNNNLNDSVVVHTDSTVPEISNVWLVRDKFQRLYVHHSTDLSSMTLSFEALDPHSGLQKVQWKFGTTKRSSDIDSGTLGVKGTNSCDIGKTSKCYCPSVGECQYFNYTLSLQKLAGKMKGLHNRRYFFKLEVTNKAALKSIAHIDILVDDSPPVKGVVMEGPVSGPDIDYTSDNYTLAQWHGFIDHESGIKMYIVGISNQCLTLSQLQYRNLSHSNFFAKETTESVTKLPVSKQGKHYITVVAFNNAMEPSEPACSDGIIKDESPPSLKNVTLKDASTAETIFCFDGKAWLIHGNVSAVQLANTTACFQRCKVSHPSALITLLPTEQVGKRDPDISEFLCTKLDDYNYTLIYLPSDKIEFTWDIQEDVSQIHDIYIGFGSAADSRLLPDLIGYQKVEHSYYYNKRHLGISHGTELYAFLKIMNKAGLETVSSYGPIIVDETPPVCPDAITVDVNNHYACITIYAGLFTDSEQREDIGSIYFRIGDVTLFDLFLYSYEAKFIQRLLSNKQKTLAASFNFTFRYIDDVLSINNDAFRHHLHAIYPPELEIKETTESSTSASYLDLLLSVSNGTLLTKLYDKRDDFDFRIVNFPFISSSIPEAPAYGVYISQLIRYARACSSYDDFVGRGRSLTTKLMTQGYTKDKLKIYGSESDYHTEFLQWSINESPTCSGNINCIKYPLAKLQKYDGHGNAEFYFDLHVYNYAGHYCSVKSKTFTIPSRVPPPKVVIRDINPVTVNRKLSFEDVDVTWTNNMYCASVSSYKRRLNTTFEIGLGTLPYSDDVVSFHVFNYRAKIYCQNITKLDEYKRYFVSVKSTCKDGISLSSSNGFIMVKSQDILHSVQIFDGKGCHMYDAIDNNRINSGNDSSLVITNTHPFFVGRPYTLELKTRGKVISVTSEAIINIHVKTTENITSIEFIAMTEIATIIVGFSDLINSSLDYTFSACINDGDIFSHQDEIWTNWKVDDSFASLITHFELRLLHYSNTTTTNYSIVYIDDKVDPKQYAYKYDNLILREGGYATMLNPCMNTICLEEVISNGFRVTNYIPMAGKAVAIMKKTVRNCQQIKLTLDAFRCSSDYSAAWYRWALFKDSTSLTKWNYIKDNDSNQKIEEEKCVQIPKYKHVSSQVCIDGFCLSGGNKRICISLLKEGSPNEFEKKTLYEINAEDFNIKRIQNEIFSANLGRKLSDLHDMELDFSQSRVMLGGIIIGLENRNVTWYVRTIPRLSSPLPCMDDSSCIISKQTSAGYVVFPQSNLIEGNIYYICAHVGSAIFLREKDNEHVKEFSSCGNGVSVDSTPPSKGRVTIVSNSGYILEKGQVAMEWNNFRDTGNAQKLGYPSDIASYSYSLGTYPFGNDVINFTDVGLSNNVLIDTNILKLGGRYYGTVTAFDHNHLGTTVTSEGVTYDTTPPIQGQIYIGSGTDHQYIAESEVIIFWKNFRDNESGIKTVEVGIGTTPYSTDTVPYCIYQGDRARIEKTTRLHDGYGYYAILKVSNRAGLTTIASSDVFHIDSSPPDIGVVEDRFSNNKSDIDYQQNTTHIGCQWSGFADPHSDIISYEVGLGTSADTDIRPLENVGLRTEIVFNLAFFPGVRYFCHVQACNGAGLCIQQTSDGVVIDNSPPIAGLVHVGTTGSHTKYVSHTSMLQAQWIGFEDPHSDISHFHVCIGKHPGKACDVLSFTNVLLASTLTKTELNMPEKTPLHVIVRAYNKVGLYTDKTSDSFSVITTPPINTMRPVFDVDNTYSSHNNVTQFDVSQLKLSWKFEDKHCPIVRQSVSLKTHHDGHTPVENVDVESASELFVVLTPERWLRDGDTYKAFVTACNQAGLCSTASSPNLVIDSTPPHLGGFKPLLKWSNEKPNANSSATVSLTWYGFVDVESGIQSYFLTVGDSYSGKELSGIFEVTPNRSTAEQHANLPVIKSFTAGQKIVLSIWAKNFAELVSSVAKVTVEAVASSEDLGFFHIEKHSCDPFYCTGDCTCAVVGKRCDRDFRNDFKCSESVGKFAVGISWGLGHLNQTVTASSACLSARWTVNDSTINILRYEWSIGLEGFEPGDGIFDKLTEHVWYDVEMRTSFTHCVPRGKQLRHNRQYITYIRAWTSPNSFSTFKSDPLLIDQTPPSIRRGTFIRDSDEDCRYDLEYSNSTNSVTTCFNKVFIDPETGIVKYTVKIGTNPGGDDVMKNTDVGLQEKITWTNLTLTPGTKYFTTVTAYNRVGLQTSYASNGFIIDSEIPYPGVVFNTEHHMDRSAQTSLHMGLSFHGFDDHQSFIKEYMVTLRNFSSSLKVAPFRSIGLSNSIVLSDIKLVHGHKYQALVKAIDASGYESAVLYSTPVLIDLTPPVGFECRRLYLIENATIYSEKESLEWNFNTSEVENPFKIRIKIISSSGVKQLKVFFDEKIHILVLAENADGSFETEETFSEKNSNIRFQITGVTNLTTAFFKVFECIDLIFINRSHNIQVKQISPNKLSIDLNVYDPETGIRNVYTGVGSTKNGLQIKPLTFSPITNNFVIDVDVEHGTPIFVTALVENYAGGKSTFSSKKIFFDHTPPFISNVKINMITNTLDTNETLVSFDIKWTAVDKESGIKHCECGLGKTVTPNIIPWMFTKDNRHFISPMMFFSHGSRITAFVRCTNKIEIRQQNISVPFTVAYLPPDSSKSEMEFINRAVRHSDTVVQRSTLPLQIGWTGFQDPAGITSYECRVINTAGTVVDWSDVGLHSYAVFSSDTLRLENNRVYTLEVMAINSGGIHSKPINKTILILDTEPRITGASATLRKSDQRVHLSWESVFIIDDYFQPIYTVFVGTRRGYTDVLWNVRTVNTYVDFNVENVTSELFVVITASYGVGYSTVYKQKIRY